MQFKQSFLKPFKKQLNVSGVYIIEIDTHVYVGSSKNIQNRLAIHRRNLRKGTGINPKMQAVYNKYGDSKSYGSVLEILNNCSPEYLLEREEYWINLLNSDLNIIKNPTKHPIPNKITSSNKKIVYQYTLNGDFVASFESATEAELLTNISKRSIALVAAKSKHYYKSAGGFQWSYIYVDKMKKYINNSDKATSKSINVFNILTGEEFLFNSISSFVKTLPELDYTNFCATASSVAINGGIFNNIYLIRYLNTKYKLPSRTSSIYNINTNKVYKNCKDAAEDTKLTKYMINKYVSLQQNGWISIKNCAAVKLRESGKPFIERQP